MECIITRQTLPGRTVISVSGALSQAQVPDLLRACGDTRGGLVLIDLTDLVSADDLAVHALRRLRTDGAGIVSASQHIQLKLDA